MLSEKKLKVIITLYDETPQEQDGQTVLLPDFSSYKTLTFDNFRIDCKIKKVAATCGYTASLDIYGVSKESLDQITTIAWYDGKIKPRCIRIIEGENNTLFEGGIMEAVPNYSSVPDVSIHIESSMLVLPNLRKVPPISLLKDTSIYSFCQTLCALGKVPFSAHESLKQNIWKGNNKVFGQEKFGDRIAELLRTVDNLAYCMVGNGYYFYPKDLKERVIYTFTPDLYHDYPTFETCGICIDTDNLIDIRCGEYFRVKGSMIPYADSNWVVTCIDYNLQARKPNGKWGMKIHGTRVEL